MVDFHLCDDTKARLDALRPLPEATLASLRNYYRIGLTYTSNAIEGNTFTESETKVLLEEGLTVAGKPLREVYETLGHAKAYDFLYELITRATIDEEVIRTLHKLFYQQIDPEHAGCYREIPVVISGSRYPLPPPQKVPAQMRDFIEWFNASEKCLHPVEFAALVHQKFVFIHPFIDGNGRVARLLMNLALLRAGYALAIIPPILRHDYIVALERAHTTTAPFITFIRDRVIETQLELLRLLNA